MSEGVITALKELHQDAKLCKNRHFASAERKLRYHIICGVPIIIINLFLGSFLINSQRTGANPSSMRDLEQEMISTTSTTKSTNSSPIYVDIATVLAFLCASIGGIQTFFNFHRSAEGHRSVANRYIEVSALCKALILKNKDGQISAKELWDEHQKIRAVYAKINTDAEAFPSNARDLKKALAKNSLTPFSLQTNEQISVMADSDSF